MANPATAATTFFSLARVKEYLGAKLNDRDQAIIDIADGVCRRIEELTARKFVTRSETRQFDACGKTYTRLLDYPIVAITSVKTRSAVGESWTTFDPAAYETDLRLGTIHLVSDVFYAGPLTTEVVYTTGYGAQDAATIPLFQTALDIVKFAYTRQANGLLVAGSVNQGNASATIVPGLPKDLHEAVMAWRKVRV